MSIFVNTVDSIGDEALASSIIDKSITEILDNYVTSIGNSAFFFCSELITANFPAVTDISANAFNGCTALTTVDLSAAPSIGGSAFYNCSNLKSLILRSAAMATLSNASAFSGTPIKSPGTGYIYVPAALVDSYKAADNWSTYANQFRSLEDYTVDGTTTGALDASKI